MSDIVRDFISENSVAITDEEILQRRKDKSLALAALDAERAEHAKEVADLKKQLEVARESLSWYEKRDIMRQTGLPCDTQKGVRP